MSVNILIIIIFNIHITTETKLIINKCIINDHINKFCCLTQLHPKINRSILHSIYHVDWFSFSTVNFFFLKMKNKCYLSFCFKWLKPEVPVWLPIAGARRTSGGCGCSRAVKSYTRTASLILWYAPTGNWRECVFNIYTTWY